MTPTLKTLAPSDLEFRVRLIFHDNSVRVGGYLGTHDQWISVLDEMTGEILRFHGSAIDTVEARKYTQ